MNVYPVYFFAMFRVRHSRAVAGLLLPAVLTFAVQSALEVIHPIEEDVDAGHFHVESFNGPIVHDADGSGFGEHDHHYCAHSNAVAHVEAPTTGFQRVNAAGTVYIESRSILLRPFFSVCERGPPIL